MQDIITQTAATSSDGATSRICIQIFIFRGEPDAYYKRHSLLYFTSPDDAAFHETVHAQRDGDEGPWVVYRLHGQTDWVLSFDNYESHVNAGAVLVPAGQEMRPVDLAASTPVGEVRGEGTDTAWNCQHFVLGALQKLVDEGLQTREWYEVVEGEMMEKVLDGAVE